jgi:uncharacterized protein YaiI (UPF0178 family)
LYCFHFYWIKGTLLTQIFVDADACPVKRETFRVARRYGLKVFVVSNTWMRIPAEEGLELVVVDGGFDAADDWIAGRAGAGDVVVSGDILLASRCLSTGARVLDPKGRIFTEDSIGNALAKRELASHLRQLGAITGGPAPINDQDRSRFLHSLDELVRSVREESTGKANPTGNPLI